MSWYEREEGQAIVEYVILAVMVISSTIFVIQVFPEMLGNFYRYATAWICTPLG